MYTNEVRWYKFLESCLGTNVYYLAMVNNIWKHRFYKRVNINIAFSSPWLGKNEDYGSIKQIECTLFFLTEKAFFCNLRYSESLVRGCRSVLSLCQVKSYKSKRGFMAKIEDANRYFLVLNIYLKIGFKLTLSFDSQFLSKALSTVKGMNKLKS